VIAGDPRARSKDQRVTLIEQKLCPKDPQVLAEGLPQPIYPDAVHGLVDFGPQPGGENFQTGIVEDALEH